MAASAWFSAIEKADGAPSKVGEVLFWLPSTLWSGSPVVGRPDLVCTTAVPLASVIVALLTSKTILSLVADCVCNQTPSASRSAALTVYSKRRVWPSTTSLRLTTLRLLARSLSSAPRSSRTRMLELPPATVTSWVNVTSMAILSFKP